MKTFSTIVLSLIVSLPSALGRSSPAGSIAPYPASKVITKLTWDPNILIMENCVSGDNWPIAWVNGNLQITIFCDGKGFSEQAPDLSQGFAGVFGDPPDFRAENFKSDADTPMGGGSKGIKASDMIIITASRQVDQHRRQNDVAALFGPGLRPVFLLPEKSNADW